MGKGEKMALKDFTLEYWVDDDWYVGRLKEIPGVFSQGETLKELEDNIRDAYKMLIEEDMESLQISREVQTKKIGVDV
jgi:predicted RNase H-like HicB family nuclease